MNIKSRVELLKHFLYLFIFINVAGGVVVVLMTNTCNNLFNDTELLPLGLPVPHEVIEISIDLIFCVISTFGFIYLLSGLLGLVGICTLNKWEAINFTFGILMLKATVSNLVMSEGLTLLSSSYDEIIESFVNKLFDSVNKYNVTRHFPPDESMEKEENEMWKNNPRKIYNLNFTSSGWSLASEGTVEEQTFVDFIQLNMHCCGRTGRSFWDMKVPRSCCSERYVGTMCVLSVAYSEGCLYQYHRFRDCISSLRAELVCFGIVAFLAALDALYLAYLKVLFPDGNYQSDKSSDDEEVVPVTPVATQKVCKCKKRCKCKKLASE